MLQGCSLPRQRLKPAMPKTTFHLAALCSHTGTPAYHAHIINCSENYHCNLLRSDQLAACMHMFCILGKWLMPILHVMHISWCFCVAQTVPFLVPSLLQCHCCVMTPINAGHEVAKISAPDTAMKTLRCSHKPRQSPKATASAS